jgi:hypothetical protein
MTPLLPWLAMVLAELAGGSLIFLGFLIATVFVVAYSYYTRRGSGINQRPRGSGRGDAQGGAAGRSRMSSGDAGGEPPPDYRN